MQVHPHPHLRRLTTVTLFLSALSLVAILTNLSIFAVLYPKIVAFELLPVWTDPVVGLVIGPGLLILGLFHLVALATLGWQIQVLQHATPLRAALFGFGVVSLMFLVSNVPLLSDIGNQYEARLETDGEWLWVFTNHGLHTLFVVLGSLAVAHADRVLRSGNGPERAELDEVVFLSTHYIGIFSGMLGLGALVVLVATRFPTVFFAAGVGVFSIIFLAPYLVALIAWVILTRFRSANDWTDEKQSQDLARAAHWSLAISLPVLGAAYSVQHLIVPDALIRHLWFPLVGFLFLLVFSGSASWFARRI